MGCIMLLNTYRVRGIQVTHLSLDHDLGPADLTLSRYENGYDVLAVIEEWTFLDPTYTPPPRIDIHSANGGARPRMALAIESIAKRQAEKLRSCKRCGGSKSVAMEPCQRCNATGIEPK